MNASMNDTRHAWVTAVLEGRYATADYLAPGLPPVGNGNFMQAPAEERETFACAGEIHTVQGMICESYRYQRTQ